MTDRRATRRHVRRLAIATLVVLGASACDWTMGGYDGGNTNVNSSEPSWVDQPLQLTRRWTVDAGSWAPITVAGGAVYAETERWDDVHQQVLDWDLLVLDAATGATRHVVAGTQGQSVAVADGLVFVAPADALVALRTTDWTEAWRVPVPGAAVMQGRVAVHVVGTTVFMGNVAFDARTGAVRWTAAPELAILAVSGGVVYASATWACSGTIVELDASTGQPLGSLDLGERNWASGVVVAGGWLTASLLDCGWPPSSHGTATFDLLGGSRRWTDGRLPPFAADGRTVFTANNFGVDRNVWQFDALRAADGQPAWPTAADCGGIGAVVGGGVVFSGDAGGLCALDQETGAVLGRWPTAGNPVALANGCVYTTGPDAAGTARLSAWCRS